MALLFSVVIPTRNRAPLLRRLLDALPSQDLPSDRFEVIVSDDGSTDETAALLAASGVRFVSNRNAGPAAARNAGASLATAPWLAFLDDDSLPAPGWLSAAARFVLSAPSGSRAAEGDVLCRDPLAPLSHGVDHAGLGGYLSCNLVVERAVFESLGGFNARFVYPMNDDFDFFLRLSAVTRISWVQGMTVHHPRYPLPFLKTLKDAPAFARRRFFSDQLLYTLHPQRYGRVKHHGSARATLRSLAFLYLFSETRKLGSALALHPVRGLGWLVVCAARQAAFLSIFFRGQS